MSRTMSLATSGALALALGCGSVGPSSLLGHHGGSPTHAASQGSASTAATVARSYRLDPGYFFGHDVRPFKSVTYVLDLSGSMSERTGSTAARIGREHAASTTRGLLGSRGGVLGSAASDAALGMDKKVELVKDHLNASLRGLASGAKFNIVLFSDGIRTLSPTMIPANGATTTLVGGFVAKLSEGGSTNLKAAIEAGLATDAEDVIVLTDGLPTDSTPEQILSMVAGKNAEHARRVFTVGVGDDQAESFLSRLAEDNGGQYLAYR